MPTDQTNLYGVRVVFTAGDDDVTFLANPSDVNNPNWNASGNISGSTELTGSLVDIVQITDVFAGSHCHNSGADWETAGTGCGIDEIRVATTWAETIGVIPEPTSLFLLATGALSLAMRRKNR